MKRIATFLSRHIKIIFIIWAIIFFLLICITYNAIHMADFEAGNDRDLKDVVLYYEVEMEAFNHVDYKEIDSFMDEDAYSFYSPIFATLRNECKIESSQYCRYYVNDNTVVVMIHQKSDNELYEIRAFHINDWTGWNRKEL